MSALAAVIAIPRGVNARCTARYQSALTALPISNSGVLHVGPRIRRGVGQCVKSPQGAARRQTNTRENAHTREAPSSTDIARFEWEDFAQRLPQRQQTVCLMLTSTVAVFAPLAAQETLATVTLYA